MPSGKAHRKLGCVTAPIIVLAGWTLSGFSFEANDWLSIATVVAGFVTSPAVLSPDMDLVHSDPSDAWGVGEPLWWGYQLFIHKRGGRNPLSHWPPMSSLIRLFYLWFALLSIAVAVALVVNLVALGLSGQILVTWEMMRVALLYWYTIFSLPHLWRFLWGVCLGDLVHVVADITYSYMRK